LKEQEEDGVARRLLMGVSAGLWGLMGLAWVGWILTQHGVFTTAGRLLLPMAAFSAVAAVAVAAKSALGSGNRQHQLLALALAMSFVVRLVGVDHEVDERAYRDEGTYYHHATKINEGEVLRFSFVYPHLTYYLDAFTLWLTDLYPEAWKTLAGGIYGVSEELARSWLALRLTAALVSALAVVPVFFMGLWLSGLFAATAASALLVFSPLFNDGSHLIISDAPSGVFATICLAFVCRLLKKETLRDYLLAGLAAGLAAGTKYPAGVVAIAIIAVWVRHRLRERQFSWSLLWAGLASFATFVAVSPTMAFYPRLAILGERGVLFGVRQYSKGGWIGVMPESNTLYYGGELVASFGLPALLLGAVGLLLLPRGQRGPVLWMAVYPVAFLALIGSMNMVVLRNLYPVVPILAVLLGVGLASLSYRLRPWVQERFGEGGAKLAVASLAVLAMAIPIRTTALQAVALAQPSTRNVTAQWVQENVPQGAAILKESYTPRLNPAFHALRQSRFAGRIPVDEIRQTADLLILAKPAYHRFLDPEERTKEHHEVFAARYEEILSTFEPVVDFPPTATRRGPWLEVYRVPPQDTAPLSPGASRAVPHGEIFVPDGSMRKPKLVRFTRPGQWCLAKARLPAGPVSLTLSGEHLSEGTLRVRDLDNSRLAEIPFTPLEDSAGGGDLSFALDLPRPGLTFLYFYLPEGAGVRAVEIARPPSAE